MNKKFKQIIKTLESKVRVLKSAEKHSFNDLSQIPNKPVIYVFYSKNKKPIHVGRTRKLKNRIRGHLSFNPNAASFVFKITRTQLGLSATYKQKQSRQDHFNKRNFQITFQDNQMKLRQGTFSYLIIEDPLIQYLLELYAHLEFNLPTDEFETH